MHTHTYPHLASNGRYYRFIRNASIDGYIWVEFQDNQGVECMVYDVDNIAA